MGYASVRGCIAGIEPYRNVLAGSLRPLETKYRGCRFRSRLEARWAVFFDALGIKWWYEPEGFALRFDYEDFAAGWDMAEDELLEMRVPQTFKHLDGKEYWYLPDFYLPESNFWVEIKGPNPSREELERAFILSSMAHDAGRSKIAEAKTEVELSRAFEDFFQQGVYIIYGDIPWAYPEKGNIFGYGARHHSGSYFFATEETIAGEAQRKETEYRDLLMGQLRLCWQECPLCLKVGVGEIDTPYCRSCHDRVAEHLWTHLAEYRGVSGSRTEATKGLMNPEFFASGHRSPKLREAYDAARAARFEHGQSPE